MTDIDVIMAALRAAQAQRVAESAEAVVALHAAIAATHPDYQTLTEQLATATQRIAELETGSGLQEIFGEPDPISLTQGPAEYQAANGGAEQEHRAKGRLPDGTFKPGTSAWFEHNVLTVPLDPAPGTGAWAWQQMQRGPDVWVRRREMPVTSNYHMKHPGLIEGSLGSQFNGSNPAVLEQMYPLATDWEFCAAPTALQAIRDAGKGLDLSGVAEQNSKQAEFFALADSVAENPGCPLTGQDGPTEDRLRELLDDAITEGKTTPFGLLTAAWQAARVGMVTEERLAEVKAEVIQWSRSYETRCAERDELRVELKGAVGELERLKAATSLPSSDGLDWVQRYERVCAERDEAARRQEVTGMKLDAVCGELAKTKAESESWQLRAERMKTRLADEQESHKYTRGRLQRAEEQRDAWHSVASALDVRTEHGDEGEPRSNDDILGEVNEQVAGLLVDSANLQAWEDMFHARFAIESDLVNPDKSINVRDGWPSALLSRWVALVDARDAAVDDLTQLKADCGPGLLFTIAGLRADLDKWSTWAGIHSQMAASADASREFIAGELRRLRELQERYETVCAERDTAFAESAAAREDSSRLTALLTPASAWTAQIAPEQVGAAWDALSEGEGYVATKWDALKPGHREHYVKVVNSVLQVPAPASDEVLDYDYEQLSRAAGVVADRTEGIDNQGKSSWSKAYGKHLIRLARRNHGPKDTELESLGLLRAECANWREWAGMRSGTTNPEEYTDEELRQGVDKTLSAQLPLSDAAREELAKVVFGALGPVSNNWAAWAATCIRIIDAIAPRIARVGLREVTVSEIAAASEHLRVVMTGRKDMQLCIMGQAEFARAILAAAQGGEMRIGVDLATGPDETAYTTRVDGKWRNATPEEIAAAGGFALPRPPRGRKLTDGERKKLASLANMFTYASTGEPARQQFAPLCSYIESLLAPQESHAVTEQCRSIALHCSGHHAPAWERTGVWGNNYLSKEIQKRCETGAQAIADLLAPQDEVRAELGALVRNGNTWTRVIDGALVFVSDTDAKIRDALSATPGDKFEFYVGARRVE